MNNYAQQFADASHQCGEFAISISPRGGRKIAPVVGAVTIDGRPMEILAHQEGFSFDHVGEFCRIADGALIVIPTDYAEDISLAEPQCNVSRWIAFLWFSIDRTRWFMPVRRQGDELDGFLIESPNEASIAAIASLTRL